MTYDRFMFKFRFNKEKNDLLKELRNIDLDEIVKILEKGDAVDIIDHPTREDSLIFLVDYKGYIVCIPCVEEKQESGDFFIKTAFHSRKLNKIYKGGKKI